MKLFISGKTSAFNTKNIPPRVKKMQEFLDASKDGELFSTIQLAGLLHRDFHNIKADSYGYLPEYSYKIKNTRYWGKPATIKQLIKETNNGR